MRTHIHYILLSAFRDYLFLALLAGLAVAFGISITLGSTAMVEKEAMSIAFAAASCRLIVVFGLIIFIAFHLRQAFDQKEIDVLLSRPLSRTQVMLAYGFGFGVIAFMLTLAAATLLSFLPRPYLDGYVMWSLSLLLESWLVVAVTLFASFTLSSAVTSVLATMGIYIMGRMMAFFVATIEARPVFEESWLNMASSYLMKGLSMIMPRLDLFTQSDWLVYGLIRLNELEYVLVQAVIYIPLLFAAAIIDFKRREF